MKRVVSLLLAVILLVGMVGCKKDAPQEKNWQSEYDLGVRYLNESRYDDAVAAFRMAIEIDPKQKSAYIGLADVYTAMDDIEEAINILIDALNELGDDPEIIAALEALGVTLEDEYTVNEDGMYRVDVGESEENYLMILEDEAGREIRREVYNDANMMVHYTLYEYDGNGVLRESRLYTPQDALWGITQYAEDGIREKTTTYDEEGAYSIIYFRHDAANEWEREEFYSNTGKQYAYVLASFDASGNQVGAVSYYPDGKLMSEEGHVSFDYYD